MAQQKYQTFDKKGAENQFLGDFLGQKSENGSQFGQDI
jgi:hypothetical protein